MKHRLSKLTLAVMVLPLLGLGAASGLAERGVSSLLVEYAVYDMVRAHSCFEWFQFPSRQVLMENGQQAVLVLRRRLNEPGQRWRTKLRLAGQLCELGDTSQFQIFIDDLRYPYHQSLAIFYLRSYPQLSRLHLSAILKASRVPQHQEYWELLNQLAGQSALSEAKKEALLETLNEVRGGSKGLARIKSRSYSISSDTSMALSENRERHRIVKGVYSPPPAKYWPHTFPIWNSLFTVRS